MIKMPVLGGYAGKALYVDLTRMKAISVPIDKFWTEYTIDPREWIGGDGFITKVLWEDFPRMRRHGRIL